MAYPVETVDVVLHGPPEHGRVHRGELPDRLVGQLGDDAKLLVEQRADLVVVERLGRREAVGAPAELLRFRSAVMHLSGSVAFSILTFIRSVWQSPGLGLAKKST